jgi:hypothetical protein
VDRQRRRSVIDASSFALTNEKLDVAKGCPESQGFMFFVVQTLMSGRADSLIDPARSNLSR